ncbi:MAG: dihydroorotate dehydrogenase electron transfer subunit [Acetivibrionales bacterium]|jgi:dihydroorotate dehydrogenase electron transfer subunit|nr:dihydroorotate dehydrogenase electron transfer subunit [Clostridiaceae bacterium]
MDTIYEIVKADRLNDDTYVFTIKSETIAKKARAGQIVHIKCGEETTAFLRRPFSICSVDKEEGTVDIAFQIRGKGTKLLSEFAEGNTIDVMGPLGQGFSLYPKHKKIIVVGGGIGIFPLLQLLKDHPAEHKRAILGFRSKDRVILEDSFKNSCDELIITTDDGSIGRKCFVTDALKEEIEKDPPDMVFFCGPTIMMKVGVGILKDYDIPCQVSLEQRMGCGIGACLTCVCKEKKDEDWDYVQVCKRGPVFDGNDIIFD